MKNSSKIFSIWGITSLFKTSELLVWKQISLCSAVPLFQTKQMPTGWNAPFVT